MTSLKDVKKRAAALGAIVEDIKEFNTHTCSVEAPKGYIWAGCDVHELVDSTNQPWKPDYADLLNRMSYGVAKCANPGCDWCY